MAKVWIVGRISRRHGPAGVRLTGEPAEHLVTVRIASTPKWIWVLLPVSLLSFALANWYGAVKVDGALPLTDAVLEWHQRLKRVIRGLAVSTVALLVLAAFAGSEVLAIVGGALAVLRPVKNRPWRPRRIG